MNDDAQPVMGWRVVWIDVSHDEQLAYFQASRRSGSAPDQGQEVVRGEDYDALLADRDRLAARVAQLNELVEAQDNLLVAYRIGSIARGAKAVERVARARAALDAASKETAT